jgi:hypothetical protein
MKYHKKKQSTAKHSDHACNPSTQKAEADPGLPSELETSLGYVVRPFQKAKERREEGKEKRKGERRRREGRRGRRGKGRRGTQMVTSFSLF